MTIDIKPGEPGSAAPAQQPSLPGRGGGTVTVVNQDIRYLKPLTAWKSFNGYLLAKPWFLVLCGLPLLLLAGAFGYIKWTERLSTDIAFARRLRASGTARKYLKKARSLLQQDPSEYYCALSRAVLEYVAHKLNVSADGLTMASLTDMLVKRGVRPETAARIRKMLEECDLVRFAPTAVSPEMARAIYTEAEELITLLERELR